MLIIHKINNGDHINITTNKVEIIIIQIVDLINLIRINQINKLHKILK